MLARQQSRLGCVSPPKFQPTVASASMDDDDAAQVVASCEQPLAGRTRRSPDASFRHKASVQLASLSC